METLRYSKILISAILLSGCVHNPTPLAVEPKKDPTAAIPLPLEVSHSALARMSDDELHSYVSTLNWNTFRSYSALRVINQYAASRGWEPPKTAPICRYARIPSIPDMPSFKADAIEGKDDLERKLMVYVYDAQTENDITRAVFEEKLSQMRFFCIY